MTRTDILFLAGAVGVMGACGGAGGATSEAVGSSAEAVTVCAGGSTVEGVDVSVYQGSINWAAVKSSGRGFAIARVSDGTGTPDTTFDANWSGIKAAGLVRGAYQFFRASDDPTAQANLVLSKIGTLGAGDLPPIADVELMDGQSGATLVANLAVWIAKIKAGTGRNPIIYTGPGFWNALPGTSQFSGVTLWVANWQVSCPDTPSSWTAWDIWQYADNGSVPGINGAVDVDRFNGTLAQLQQLAGGGSVAATWGAGYVSQSFPLATTALEMTAGETLPSYIELKNVGTKTWDTNTRIGTTEPRDRASAFSDATWISSSRAAAVAGTVPPGATYKFKFDLHAPTKPGTYFEHFGVLEEGVVWFGDPGQAGPPDGDLEVQVHVTLPDGGASASDASSAATDAARPDDGGARDTGASDSAASDAATGRDAASALAQAGDAATRGDTVDAEVVATPPSTPTGADADASGEGPLAGSATPGQAGGCAVARPGGETGGLWAVAALVSTALGAARRRRRQASRA